MVDFVLKRKKRNKKKLVGFFFLRFVNLWHLLDFMPKFNFDFWALETWRKKKKINFPFMINYCKNVHHLWQFLINGYFLVLSVFFSPKKGKKTYIFVWYHEDVILIFWEPTVVKNFSAYFFVNRTVQIVQYKFWKEM